MKGWIELKEYEAARLEPERLSMEAGMLLFRRFGRHVQVEFPGPGTDGQWRLTPRGWAGFIPLGRDEGLRILPRFPAGHLFLMLEYAYRLKSFRILDGLASVESLEGFVDRVVHLLASRILDRIRRGLHQEFRKGSGDLPAVRGRLNVGRMAKKPLPVRVPCDFRTLTADCEDNRILLWTLHRVNRGNLPVSRETARHAVRAYRNLMEIVSLRPFKPEDCAGRTYHSLNRDYALLHALCRLILDGEVPDHVHGSREMFPFLVDMPRLFEMFVAEWMKAHAPARLRIRAQERVGFGEAGKIRFHVDLAVYDRQSGRPLCVMDTKYKPEEALTGEDIAQVVAYALSFGCREAVLVVPAGRAGGLDERIGGIRVRSLRFDLSGDPEEGGRRLLREWLGESGPC